MGYFLALGFIIVFVWMIMGEDFARKIEMRINDKRKSVNETRDTKAS